MLNEGERKSLFEQYIQNTSLFQKYKEENEEELEQNKYVKLFRVRMNKMYSNELENYESIQEQYMKPALEEFDECLQDQMPEIQNCFDDKQNSTENDYSQCEEIGKKKFGACYHSTFAPRYYRLMKKYLKKMKNKPHVQYLVKSLPNGRYIRQECIIKEGACIPTNFKSPEVLEA